MAAITQNAAGGYLLNGNILNLDGTESGTADNGADNGIRIINDTDPFSYFSGNITITEPLHITCALLNSDTSLVSPSVVIVNAPVVITYLSGLTSLTNDDATFDGNNNDDTWTINANGSINWICINNAENGFGTLRNTGTGNTQTLRNMTFTGFSNLTSWFCNMAGLTEASTFENINFVQAVLNSPTDRTTFTGFNFDGTIRPQNNTRYTIRYQQSIGSVATPVQGIITNTQFAGTAYDADLTGNQHDGTHYQFQSTNAQNHLYSINNRYENDNIVVANNNATVAAAARLFDGFTFALRPAEAGLTGRFVLPEANFAVTGITPLTAFALATVRGNRFFEPAQMTDGNYEQNGYFVETGQGTPEPRSVDAGQILLANKAIDFATDTITAGQRPVLRYFSYTHIPATQTETIVNYNPFTIANNIITFTNFTEIPCQLDVLTATATGDIDAGTYAIAPIDAPTVDVNVLNGDEAYRVLKQQHFATRPDFDFSVTSMGSTLVWDANQITFSSAANSSILDQAITLRAGTSFTSGALINSHNFGNHAVTWGPVNQISNITIDAGIHTQSWNTVTGVTFADTPQVEFTGDHDIRGWDFTGGFQVDNTSGGNIEIIGTAAQIANLVNGDAATITLTARNQAYPIIFTHEADTNSNGGQLAVFRRASLTGSWSQVGSTRTATGDNQVSVSVQSDITATLGEYLVIWRPHSTNYYTTVRRFDFTVTLPTINEATITVPKVVIPDVVLTSETNPATVVWTSADVIDDDTSAEGIHNEVIGTITGAHDTRLNGGETQALLLEAYSDAAYLTTFVSNVDMIFGTGAFDATVDIWDIITPTSSASTAAQGRYVQLDTGDGTQQQITALINTDGSAGAMTDFITADIIGAETGTGQTIQFPAVQIFDNPQGISTDQVRTALFADLNIINNNVVVASVKPAAVQTAQNGNVQL